MLKRMFGCFAVVAIALAMHQPVAAGPNANAVLSWDIDASDNKRDDGNTSGTVAGAGTDVVVEVFITGLAGPIIGGAFSIDTNRLTVKSAAATPGLSVLGTTARTVSLGGFPPGVALPNGYLGTVTLTTTSDVTGTEFTVSASINVADGTSPFATDMLTAATPLTFNASTQTPTPDFNGDGTVGFADFLEFAGQFGTRRGDGRYQAKYDLNSDGAIDFRDFLSFAGSYGQSVPPSGGGGGGSGGGGSGGSGGGSSSPDLIVESPSVSDSTLTPGQSFTLQATVRNRGTGQSASTTLRYYRSSNSTISTSDTEVGTDSVSGLSASRTGSESISLTAPSSTGTYYYGACVASVSGETDTRNNCSTGVRVTVSSGSGGGGSGGSGGGSSSPDLIVESPSVSDSTLTPGQSFTLQATVRNRGTGQSVSTTLRYYRSTNSTISTSDTEVGTDSVSGLSASGTGSESISLTAPSSTGTYYYGACVRAVSGETDTRNNCSTGVRVTVSSGSGGGGGSSGGGTPKMYWTDDFTDEAQFRYGTFLYGTGRISRANLDGSQVEIVRRPQSPTRIALDVEGRKMYWTGNSYTITNRVGSLIWYISYGLIQRASLDGRGGYLRLRNVRDQNPRGIALDVGRGKMYWAANLGRIYRANLDGSQVEIILRGLRSPNGIALDVGGGKMYWTDYGTDKIQRANLDGSNVEDLITTGLSGPSGIALDVGGGKMYWTDYGTDKIQRANLDGSQVEDLITTGLRSPSGIALDVGGGKMYWTDYGTDKIQRANLDGSNVEDLITTGLDRPSGIALDLRGQ